MTTSPHLVAQLRRWVDAVDRCDDDDEHAWLLRQGTEIAEQLLQTVVSWHPASGGN